jgi:putative flippase GtrA
MTERAPQAPVSPAAAAAEGLWRAIPGPVQRRLRTNGGRRLIRFAPAAVLAFGATQLTYFVLQLLNVTAGIAGAAGWLTGAVVSYVVSRWAWERKGRPQLLKETLPFAVISICVGVALTGASKFASYEASVLGLHGLHKVLFDQGIYLAANCVTFVIRFLIFHYVLFADRGPTAPELSGASGASGPLPGAEPLELSPLAGEPEGRGSSRTRRLLSRSQVRTTTRTKLSA